MPILHGPGGEDGEIQALLSAPASHTGSRRGGIAAVHEQGGDNERRFAERALNHVARSPPRI